MSRQKAEAAALFPLLVLVSWGGYSVIAFENVRQSANGKFCHPMFSAL
jgi:hypothetical protein